MTEVGHRSGRAACPGAKFQDTFPPGPTEAFNFRGPSAMLREDPSGAKPFTPRCIEALGLVHGSTALSQNSSAPAARISVSGPGLLTTLLATDYSDSNAR